MFGKIVDNIKAVAERGLLKVSIRVNIDTRNEADARRLLGVLHSEGLLWYATGYRCILFRWRTSPKRCMLLASCAGACAFKFEHHDYASGESAKLPCPSLKFNLSEQLFMRARQAGVVEEGDWDPERSATVSGSGALTGERHSLT